MSNPATIVTTVNAWTKVATDVKKGWIWIHDSGNTYAHTYRLTGGAAPTQPSEGVRLPNPGAEIKSDIGIDVYIYTTGSGDGKVRVDI
jgi:hypothetical protein